MLFVQYVYCLHQYRMFQIISVASADADDDDDDDNDNDDDDLFLIFVKWLIKESASCFFQTESFLDDLCLTSVQSLLHKIMQY